MVAGAVGDEEGASGVGTAASSSWCWWWRCSERDVSEVSALRGREG